MLVAILTFCGAISAQAQVMKAADLEKYAKERYGTKWLEAAKNLSKELTLDKNQSLTYQQVIEVAGKTKDQLYVALNYWATATFKDNNAITLNDKEAGCNNNLYDEHWEIAKHYPFVEKDAQKRTCAKALVMTHAYSNAIIDKVEEALKSGIVGNEDDDW